MVSGRNEFFYNAAKYGIYDLGSPCIWVLSNDLLAVTVPQAVYSTTSYHTDPLEDIFTGKGAK